jgi:hypothetical protein
MIPSQPAGSKATELVIATHSDNTTILIKTLLIITILITPNTENIVYNGLPYN